MEYSGAADALARKPEPKKRPGKRTLREVHIRKAKGGYVAKHVHDGHPDQEHIIANKGALMEHMAEAFPGE